MSVYTESLSRLMAELGKLPGIGARTAERLALHLLKTPEEEAMALAQAIRDVKHNTRHCSTCCNVTEQDPCGICSDSRRDHTVLCVVEQPRDLLAIEKTGAYRGVYHVLMGRIAPLEDVHPEDLTIGRLVQRIKTSGVKEVILYTNPDLEGDVTAQHLAHVLQPLKVKVSLPARGIPTGSQIEYASETILRDALEGRREIPS
ncbi:MAG TPA: recombination mediator RecR [Planctomycetota bacterium]|nr:recombination mediator RecR [Planctomycetota bacterium]